MTPAQRLLHSRAIAGFSVALATFGLLLLIRQAGWLQGLELALYDAHMKLRPAATDPDSPVVIIGIDEDDIRQWGYPLPDKTLHAALRQLVKSRPAVIGIDFFRDIPYAGREALAEFVTAHPNIVFVKKSLGKNIAPPEFAQPEQIGFADLKQDASGVIRRGLLMLWNERGEPELSFSLQMALAYLRERGLSLEPAPGDRRQVRLGKTTITRFHANDGGYQHADDGGYQYLMRYRLGANGFRQHDFSDLLEGRLKADDFTGKAVIIGLKATSIQDRHETPFSSGWGGGPRSYGVFIHASLLDQLLAGVDENAPPPRTFAWWIESLLILIAALLGAGLAIVFEQKTLSMAVLVVVFTLLLLGTAQLLFNGNAWLPVAPMILAMITALALTDAYLAQRERKAIGQMMNLFGKFVSPEVAALLWDERDEFLEHGKPKSQRLTATVMITDLQGFVAATHDMDPADLMDWLNQYLDEMTQIAMRHGGIVDDYAGDGIKINFGVPIPRTSQAQIDADVRAAVDCALAMGARVEEINRRNEDMGMPRFTLRVGINTGTVIVGSLGSTERMKYTTVGDVVNTAARLEAFQKKNFREEDRRAYRVLVSLETRKRLGADYRIEALGDHRLPGKTSETPLFSIKGKTNLYSITREENSA